MSGKVLKLVLVTMMAATEPTLARAAEPIGAAAYRKLCAECHPRAERLASRFDQADAPEARWEAFLTRHHAPDPGDRRDLVRYFQALKNPD